MSENKSISQLPSTTTLNNEDLITIVQNGQNKKINVQDFVDETKNLLDLQEKLVSGENIKTINYESLLGAGNIDTNPPNGTNYVMVYGVGTPEENAAELQAAYDAAKNMPRYIGYIDQFEVLPLFKGQTLYCLDSSVYYIINNTYTASIEELQAGAPEALTEITEAQAKSVRTTVIVAPGTYTFGVNKFSIDAKGINVVSLTGNRDVKLDGIIINNDYIHIKGIECGAGQTQDHMFKINCNLELKDVIENCGGDFNAFCRFSLTSEEEYLGGTYIKCDAYGKGWCCNFGGFIECYDCNCAGEGFSIYGQGGYSFGYTLTVRCNTGTNSYGLEDLDQNGNGQLTCINCRLIGNTGWDYLERNRVITNCYNFDYTLTPNV